MIHHIADQLVAKRQQLDPKNGCFVRFLRQETGSTNGSDRPFSGHISCGSIGSNETAVDYCFDLFVIRPRGAPPAGVGTHFWDHTGTSPGADDRNYAANRPVPRPAIPG